MKYSYSITNGEQRKNSWISIKKNYNLTARQNISTATPTCSPTNHRGQEQRHPHPGQAQQPMR
jgi:hypothetical protein